MSIALQTFRSSYVPAASFCAIFQHDMQGLYSLALLLTADPDQAEQCFLAAFNDCVDGADVFSGWERSWSRRAIVKQAIRSVRPRPDDSDTELSASVLEHEHIPTRLLQMRPFDRFVFAMTVLERFTVRECAALLSCVPSDVENARVRVLQLLGSKNSVIGSIGDLPAAAGPVNNVHVTV